MKDVVLSPRVLGFVISTRAALGFGLGLLFASRIPEEKRRRLGIMMVAIGAATTIPAAALALSSRRRRAAAVEDLAGS